MLQAHLWSSAGEGFPLRLRPKGDPKGGELRGSRVMPSFGESVIRAAGPCPGPAELLSSVLFLSLQAHFEKRCITAGDVRAAGANAVSCSFGSKWEGQPAKEKTSLLGCNLSFQAAGIFLSSPSQLLQPKKTAYDQTAFAFLKLFEAGKDVGHACLPPLPWICKVWSNPEGHCWAGGR